MFVVVGQIAEEGKRVNVSAPPGVGPPVYSLVRLKVVDESLMVGGKLFPPRFDPWPFQSSVVSVMGKLDSDRIIRDTARSV